MKKLLSILLGFFLIVFFSRNVYAAKPAKCTTIQSGKLLTSAGDVITTGYDEWGYNYQAMLFNGKYCDAYRDAAWCQPYKEDNLMMKWNDAWLSNQDCDRDDLLDRHYGFDSYMGSGAWLTNHQSGSYEGDNWILTGDWVLSFNFGSLWSHDMTITSQTTDGEVSGIGGYPSGAIDYSHPWILTGNIEADEVDFEIIYTSEAPNPGYTVWLEGVIGTDGKMSGTCHTSLGQVCTWSTTEGAAQKEVFYWNYFVKIVAVPNDAKNIDGIWYTANDIKIGPVIWGEFAVIQEIYNDNGTGDHGVLYKSEAPKGFGFYQP